MGRRFSKSLTVAAAAAAAHQKKKKRKKPGRGSVRDRAAWRIAGARGPMAGCQGPFARKNPISRRARRVNPKTFRPAGR